MATGAFDVTDFRKLFPALVTHGDWIFAENAGGSQVGGAPQREEEKKRNGKSSSSTNTSFFP